MIDAAFPKRDQGASLSHYLLLAAFARAFHPCSKSKIGQWYEETALKREWGLRSDLFTSQHFWNAMDRINLDRLTELEKIFHCALLKKKTYLPKRSFMIAQIILLILIRSMIVILKHSEDVTRGRHDLRQLGLAVAVTPDFHIPLFHALYPGNLNDITQLKNIYLPLTERMKDLSGKSKRHHSCF